MPRPCTIILALTVLAGCADSAARLEAPTAALESGSMDGPSRNAIAWTGRCDGTSVFANPTTLLITATCQYAHIGMLTVVGTETLDGYTLSATNRYSAPNGDVLTTTSRGTFTPSADGTGGTFIGIETVVTGTGRFQDAAGVATRSGTVTFGNPNVGTYQLDGRLTLSRDGDRDDESDRETSRVTVMTRNMYIGADVDPVIAALVSADPGDDLPALLAGIDVLNRTDFPARAAAIAGEIARARPHAVGLQEVDDVAIDLKGLRPPVALHFLPMLRAELAIRGLHYVVAGDVTNFAVAPLPGVSVIDHDVILVDADRVTVGPEVIARQYTANIGPIARGVALRRGWVQVDATIDGEHVTIASTHLEANGPAALRIAQARELVGSIGTASPAILLGDFNDVPLSATHDVVTLAGFVDSWSALRPAADGYTCCELADLSNSLPLLDRRIDYVFARGFEATGRGLKGRVSLVGDRSSDRVAGPLYQIWPSDHAGVVGRFRWRAKELAASHPSS